MLKALWLKINKATDDEVIRQVLKLPRYTVQQLTAIVRKDATAYLEKMETLTLDDETYDNLKLLFVTPIDNKEQAQELSDSISQLFTDFLEEQGLKDPNPIFTMRYYLALMNEEQFVTAVNSFQAIFTRLVQTRSLWVRSQVELAQAGLAEDLKAEAAFKALTDEIGPMSGETAEA